MGLIHRSRQASPLLGTHRDGRKSAQACLTCFLTVVAEDGSGRGCSGELLVAEAARPAPVQGGTPVHGRLPGALDCWAEAMIPAVRLSGFTNGRIRNKIGIAVSLATGRGAGARKQMKAVLQGSPKKKHPISRKSH